MVFVRAEVLLIAFAFSLCDAMGLLQSWSLTKTARRLTTELSEGNLERLLDVSILECMHIIESILPPT